LDYFITENCSIKNEITVVDKYAISFLESITAQITSVKKVIVTDSTPQNYQNSVKELSLEIDASVGLTDNGVAIVIHGLNADGDFEQRIFIRGDIFHSFCLYHYGQRLVDQLSEKLDNEQVASFKASAIIAFRVVLHEIGHAVNYERLYSAYGYLTPDRKAYYLPKELDKFAEYEMMTIWSEYFAERFAFSVSRESAAPSEDDVMELLHDSRSYGVVENAGKTFRLLYWYALYIAYYHNRNEACPLNAEDDHHGLLLMLKSIGDALNKLFIEQSTWDFESIFAKLGCLFVELYNVKYMNVERS